MKSFRKCAALLSLISALAAAWTPPALGKSREKTDPKDELGAKALGFLYSAMLSEDSDVRVLAAEQWGPIGNPAAATVLKRALKDASPYVRIAAAGSLFQLGDLSGMPVVEAIVSAAPKPPDGKQGEIMSAMEEMRAIARNKVRVVAIRSLSLMGKPSSIDLLKAGLSDREGAVRDASAIALARLGEPAGIGRFIEALQSDDAQVRAQAVRSLGEIATSAVIDHLKPLAADPNSAVRAAVMEALGETGNVLVLPELSSGLKDQNELVRSKAVAALGRVQSPSALPFLEEARKGAANVYVELLALAGLARLGEKVGVAEAQRALSQPDADTRLLAIEVLETVGGDGAVENLEFALEDREMRLRVRSAAALVKLLQHKDGKGKHN